MVTKRLQRKHTVWKGDPSKKKDWFVFEVLKKMTP